MIKFPVKAVSPPLPEYMHYVHDSSGVEIAECSSHEKAETIAKALNAMNEFPELSDDAEASIDAVNTWLDSLE